MATRKFITDENLKYFAGLVKKADSALSTEITNAKNAASNAATAAFGASTEAQKKIAKGSLATINGQSLESGGNIELDFTVAEVVTTLPDITAAVKTKIYLVPSSSTETNNSYTEYIKVTVSGTDKWEKVGEYKAGIDTSVFAKAADLTSHTGNKSNPHSVTAAQVGLGNVDNTSDANKPISTATQTALNNKVDVVSGKGLSTNDYTTTEKTKLAGIAEGANKTVVDTAFSTTSTNPVQNKVITTQINKCLTNITFAQSGDTVTVTKSVVDSSMAGTATTIISAATTSKGGLLSASDKTKIDNLASTYVAESSLVSLSDTDIQTLWDNA